MKFYAMAYSTGGERQSISLPFLISLMGHLLLLGVILFKPQGEKPFEFNPASVIDVQMVEMPAAPAVSKKSAAPAASENVPVKEKAPVAKESDTSSAEAEVSVAKPVPKKKTALKYQTLKSQRVLKNALERLEKKVETVPPKPLEDTIKRLREQVEKEGPPSGVEEGSSTAATSGSQKGFGVGSKKEGEIIDLYMLEVAYQINKNWAFSQQLAGDGNNLIARVTFKVMPDGRIEDISFTDRSGNIALDESALKAIVKSSPVKPHPPGTNQPYIMVGIAFTPKGVY